VVLVVSVAEVLAVVAVEENFNLPHINFNHIVYNVKQQKIL